MKFITFNIFMFLAAVSLECNAEMFDYSIINGKWGAYSLDQKSQESFTYLEIDDSGGLYAYSYGNKVHKFEFDSSQISKVRGFLIIDVHDTDKANYRLVASAYRTEIGSSLLTGSLYMFKVEKGNEYLFNTIPQRMADLGKETNVAEIIEFLISESAK